MNALAQEKMGVVESAKTTRFISPEKALEIKEILSSYKRLSKYLDEVFERKMPTGSKDKYLFLEDVLTSDKFFGLEFKQYQCNHKGLVLKALENSVVYTNKEIQEVFVVLDELILSQKQLGFTTDFKIKLLNTPNQRLNFTQHILMGILFVGSLEAEVGLDLTSNSNSKKITSGNRNFRFGEPHIAGHNQPGDRGVKLPHTHLEFYVDLGNEKKDSFGLHVLIK